MPSPYRIKPLVSSSVEADVRVAGAFYISPGSTLALQSFVRPSAGVNASAGQGNLFTVTQPTANLALYLVTLTEPYFQPVYADAQVQLVANTPGTAGTPPTVLTSAAGGGGILYGASQCDAYCSVVDFSGPSVSSGVAQGSNSFYVWLANGVGTIPSGALTLPAAYNATVCISFECCAKNTVSPSSL